MHPQSARALVSGRVIDTSSVSTDGVPLTVLARSTVFIENPLVSGKSNCWTKAAPK